jgi:hypothetical protein
MKSKHFAFDGQFAFACEHRAHSRFARRCMARQIGAPPPSGSQTPQIERTANNIIYEDSTPNLFRICVYSTWEIRKRIWIGNPRAQHNPKVWNKLQETAPTIRKLFILLKKRAKMFVKAFVKQKITSFCGISDSVADITISHGNGRMVIIYLSRLPDRNFFEHFLAEFQAPHFEFYYLLILPRAYQIFPCLLMELQIMFMES